MQLTPVILVLGYNNTRINDVKKIRHKAIEYLGAETVLCKKNPTQDDFCTAYHVIDVDLDGNAENASIVITNCKKLNLKIIGLLPFSDKGTQLGAFLAKKLNLPGPDPATIKSALDKFSFRKAEKEAENPPAGYKKTASIRIHSLDELKSLYNKLNGKIFIKPTSEGNSRGCIKPLSKSDCEVAWHLLEKYKTNGIIVEELIESNTEYSSDHVNGFAWITEKKTTQTNYRAEYQQIVPAPLTTSQHETITAAGKFMADLSGANGGAYHNEIFYLKNSDKVAAVEPNLRPAGMRIWDLAAIAFLNFDPWKEWLLCATNKENPDKKSLLQNCYAAIRMITAPKNGVLEKIKNYNINNDFKSDTAKLLEIVWTKKMGDQITTEIEDNADFLGYFIAKSKDYNSLVIFLEETNLKLQNLVMVI